jgi:transposase-like protein
MSTLNSKHESKRGAVDWNALELEYVLGTMTMRELASNHGVNDSTLMNRATKNEWQLKREQKRAETSKTVESVATDERIAQQIAQNRADLSASAQVGAKVLEMLMYAEKPADVKALSGALKDCQAVARLALGMTTENNGQGDFDGKKLEMFSQIVIVGGKATDTTKLP